MCPSINCISVHEFGVCETSPMGLAHARAPYEITKDTEGPEPTVGERGLNPMRL